MLFYIIIFALLYILSHIEIGLNIKQSSKLPIFRFLIMFFFVLSFIRYERGTDWDAYYSFFTSNETYAEFKSYLFEPFFTLLNYIIKSITDKYYILLMVLSLIIFTLKSKIIWMYSPYPYMSILILYALYRGDIFFVRETIAIALCLYSIKYIVQQKKIHYVVCIVIASLFHASSIIFILAYYLYYTKITPQKITTCFIVLFIAGFCTRILLETVGAVLGENYLWRINAYLDTEGETFGMQDSIQKALFKGIINRGIFIVLFMYIYIKRGTSNIFKGLANLYFASVMLFLTFMPISYAFARLANSYEQVLIILMPLAIKQFNIESRRILFIIIGIYLFIRFYSFSLTGSYSEHFVPFKSIFTE